MPSWIFKKEYNRYLAKNRDYKKKPAKLKKNDNHATHEDLQKKDSTLKKYFE